MHNDMHAAAHNHTLQDGRLPELLCAQRSQLPQQISSCSPKLGQSHLKHPKRASRMPRSQTKKADHT